MNGKLRGYNVINSHLSGEEANVLPVDVLAEGHLQQSQSHVKGLDKVRFPSERVVPKNRINDII